MKLTRLLPLALVSLLALALVASACGDDDDDDDDLDFPTASGDVVTNQDGEDDGHDHEHADDADVDTLLHVHSNDTLAYDPDELTTNAGETVRLELDNSESAELHDWTIESIPVENVVESGGSHDHDDTVDDDMAMDGDDEMAMDDDTEMDDPDHDPAAFDLHVAAAAGEVSTLDFTALEPGIYTFFCTVEGHREGGMEGTLVIE